MPMTQARPDIGRRPRKDAEGDDNPQDKDGEATASDLYGILGYRTPHAPAITTQQWLAVRLIEL